MKKSQVQADDLIVGIRAFQPGIMVAAGCSVHGVFPPFFVRKNVKLNQWNYQEILEDYYKPNCEVALGADYEFMQDNAPSHSATSTKECSKANMPQLMPWPPHSPDLNPMDYCVWGLWEAEAAKLSEKVTSDAVFKGILQVAHAKLSTTAVRRAIEQWPKRLRLCVQQEGGHFEHLL